MCSDPKMSQYTLWNTMVSKQDAFEYMAALERRLHENTAVEWGIFYAGVFVGTVGLYSLDQKSGHGHLGYAVNRCWWGKGFAAEAAQEALSIGRGTLGLTVFHAEAVSENPPSIRVLEKLGFQEDGSPQSLHLKGRDLELRHFLLQVPNGHIQEQFDTETREVERCRVPPHPRRE
jgi:ribosomal-protein-alanine N-acetyltransferase